MQDFHWHYKFRYRDLLKLHEIEFWSYPKISYQGKGNLSPQFVLFYQSDHAGLIFKKKKILEKDVLRKSYKE